MGIIKNLKESRKKEKLEENIRQYYKMFNGYTPVFKSFEGGVYEYDLTRAAIHTIANHCASFKPEITGPKESNISFNNAFQFKANPLMSTYQYIYKLVTIMQIKNTAFILPLRNGFQTTGFYPVNPQCVELIQSGKDFGYKFTLPGGTFALPTFDVGVINQYLYKSDVFGETNAPLIPTIEVLDQNKQGIIEGVKNSAYLRFMAILDGTYKSETLEADRQELYKNLKVENNNGFLLFDNKYRDVKQIESHPYNINALQQQQIEENVFNYFGVNKKIMQNSFNSSEWSAFYEGKLEPIAVQLSLAHSNLLFSEREIAYGNSMIFTTDRLQYLAPDEKIKIFQTMFDRGAMTANQGAELFNRPGNLPNGDKYYIRLDYVETTKNSEVSE